MNAVAAQPPLTEEAKTWAMLAHVFGLGGFIMPLGGIIGPLIVYLVKKDVHPFIARHSKAALNFQISMTIYFIFASFVCFMLFVGGVFTQILKMAETSSTAPSPWFLFSIFLGLFTLSAFLLIDIIQVIAGAVAASKGAEYGYKLALPLVS